VEAVCRFQGFEVDICRDYEGAGSGQSGNHEPEFGAKVEYSAAACSWELLQMML
jgi:hypothetical protein